MGTQFDRAISFKELYKGLQKSQRNVLWKDSVAGYSINGLKNTYKLRQSILSGKYRISPYQRFTIHEPKDRDILATRIQDRQFQRSLCDNILYPQATRSFIRDNVACQRGRGVDDCMNRLEAHLHAYYREHGCAAGWVLQCDIKKFFPTTSHKIAKETLRKSISDPEAASYICEVIDSFSAPIIEDILIENGNPKELSSKVAYLVAQERVRLTRLLVNKTDYESTVQTAGQRIENILKSVSFVSEDRHYDLIRYVCADEFKGVGLGSQVSQITELAMLNVLDHAITERFGIKHYIRYMDDFVLIHQDKEHLRNCLFQIEALLRDLGLNLNKKTQIYKLQQGIKMLKWRFILTDSGKVLRRIGRETIIRQRRKMRKFKAKLEAGTMGMQQIRDSFQSWRANALRGDTRKEVLRMEEYYKELYGEEPPICRKRLR